jgi:hypothetical protein
MNLEILLAPPETPRVRSIRSLPIPSFGEVRYGYRPSGGLGISAFGHTLLIVVILLWGRFAFVTSPKQIEITPEVIKTDSVLYLPTFGGGSEGAGKAGGGSGDAGRQTSSLPARSRKGFAYPGPQQMVSDPPKASLGIQTILQPSLKDLPLLHSYIPLPNIIRPTVAPPAKPLVVKTESVAVKPQQTVAAPKVTLPTANSSVITELTSSTHAAPQRPAPPKAPEVSDVQASMKPQDGLLVLNAVPPPPDVRAAIPHGEVRGRFAVAPGEVTVIAQPASGVNAGTSGASAGSGTRKDLATGDTISEFPSGGNGANRSAGASGTGQGGQHGAGQGSGLNASAGGTGAGRGNGVGAGSGTGQGTSSGSGAGAGNAPGSGGFPGITIQGAHTGASNIPTVYDTVGATAKKRTPNSYNMTIVSTPSSGGGLPDFGVFQNEKVYTVYLNMRDSDEDKSPSWTLQYAVIQPDDPPGVPVNRIDGTPTPPLVSLKVVPNLPPDLLRKCEHELIVASAIMDTSGKLEQVSVRRSPVAEVTAPLVDALTHWIFEPSQIDGQPVALKVLLGIRLAMPR